MVVKGETVTPPGGPASNATIWLPPSNAPASATAAPADGIVSRCGRRQRYSGTATRISPATSAMMIWRRTGRSPPPRPRYRYGDGWEGGLEGNGGRFMERL